MDKVEKVKHTIENKHQAFYDVVYPMDIVELKENLLQYTKYLEETKEAIKTSEKLKELEAALKEAKKPYQDKIKEYKSKIEQLKKFVDDSICKEDLELQMIKYAMAAEDEKIKLDNSAEVKYAKDELDDIKKPLNEAKTTLALKIAYINILINEKEGFDPGYRNVE